MIRAWTVLSEKFLLQDHASAKVVLQVVELCQAVVSIAVLDFSQRPLQQQTAQHAHKDLHRRLKRVSSAYHAFLEHLKKQDPVWLLNSVWQGYTKTRWRNRCV